MGLKLFSLLIVTYVFLNVIMPRLIFNELIIYFITIICWLSLAFLTLKMSIKKENLYALRPNKSLILNALMLGTMQISLLVFSGFFTTFGKSPYAFTLVAITINIAYFSSALLGLELSRAYLIKTCPKRKIFMGIGLTALFYTLITVSPTRFTELGTPADAAKFLGSDILPTLAQSLLATYLALLGGPTASIAYLGVLEAFEWLSPILPNPPWAIKALITTLIPTIGFLMITQTVSPFMLMRYGIISRTEAIRRPRTAKKLSPSLSWTAIAIIAVILLWGSTGLLGFQPNVIASGSMRPTLEVGDIAITVPTPPEKIKVGDIIQYWRSGEPAPTIHRVIEITQAGGTTYITTKGDANTAPDEPIMTTRTLGKVVLTIPKLGWISIILKTAAANAYTFLTTTLPNTITQSLPPILTNSVYITTALALTAYAYLLHTYHKTAKKEEGP
ncbi:MAG: signal peptidase I [Candidatus Bathyarchaeia archaeon]